MVATTWPVKTTGIGNSPRSLKGSSFCLRLPGDSDPPPWEIVYQQAQRWLKAGCSETLAEDLRVILRLAAGQSEQPTAVIVDRPDLALDP